MSDKDLLIVISDMLRKQDQQAEKLGEHSSILNQHTEILNQHTGILNQHTGKLKELNENFKNFVDLSFQQFQQQQVFNERFLNSLETLNERFMVSHEQQNNFNERFLNKLTDIENKL